MGDQPKQIQHFSHEQHPLIFKEWPPTNNIGASGPVFCNGCEDQVNGPSYSCLQCPKLFILHKSCEELPSEIHNHPIHNKHKLTLVTSTVENLRPKKCHACQQHCKGSFNYSCSECDFHLHLKCASNWRNIMENVDSSSHDHKFTVLKKPLGFTCDACGKDGTKTAPLYLCSICQLLVHKECSWLPSHANIPTHQHTLNLTWSFEDIYPKDIYFCRICFLDMEKSPAVYSCHEAGCSYAAHNTCALHQFGQKPPEPTATTTAGDEPQQHINHFNHPHILTLMNIGDHHDRKMTCEGCMRPIAVSDPCFYCCKEEECNFFVHKTCGQLPPQMHHPIHHHLLTLLQRPYYNSIDDGVFKCYVCRTFSQGFAYHCDPCNFYVDIHCTTLSVVLRHDAHAHPLYLNLEPDKKCSGCGTPCSSEGSYFLFSCKKCNFHLCIPCVKFPPTATHRYDTHPLKLTYESPRNELKEYYCEICEGERDPAHWFYSCKDCDLDFHPNCILGLYPQVKLGGAYKLQTHPQHLVTLVEKRESPIPNDKRRNILSCKACGDSCQGLVLECSICNINVHRDCNKKLSF